MKNKSYISTAISGPSTNIVDKYIIYNNGIPVRDTIITEPLARKITINKGINVDYTAYNATASSNSKEIKRNPVINNRF